MQQFLGERRKLGRLAHELFSHIGRDLYPHRRDSLLVRVVTLTDDGANVLLLHVHLSIHQFSNPKSIICHLYPSCFFIRASHYSVIILHFGSVY